MRLLFLSAVVFLINLGEVCAQSAVYFRGRVIDVDGKPVEFASIRYEEGKVTVGSNNRGEFSFPLISGSSVVSVHIAFVGKKAIEQSFERSDIGREHLFRLEDLSLTLAEVTVTPQFKQSDISNSSITFNRQAIEQVQAFSLMDVLNTLPGRATVAPDLHRPQMITLRGGQGSQYDFNNSLGVSIIMDGVVQSNDANMQSRSLSRFGMAGSLLGATSTYGSFDTPFQGLDLREIPVENIESIEVVQGVASAKYGEITDGAIIVERQAGRTPYQFILNINGGSSSYSLSKGFNLGNRLGAFNTSTNYTVSNSDPRDKVQQYDRISQSVMWTKNWGSRIKNTLSLDYNRRLDELKQDPDDDTQQQTYSGNEGVRVSTRLSADVNLPLLSKLSAVISYSGSRQESYKLWLLNGAPKPYTNKDTTGIYEGYFLDGRYLAEERILGAPRSASANLNLTGSFRTGQLTHLLSYGLSYSASNNGGKGIAADPDRPRWIDLAGQNERPYSFESVPGLTNYGLYVEDRITVTLAGRPFSSGIGIRNDWQNGISTLQPRINSRYGLSKRWSVNAAFGVSTKAPTLAHRYPSPTWLDIPLLLLFSGQENGSLYLVYTEKTIPDNSHLKPSVSSQTEIGMQYRGNMIQSSVFVYAKNNRNGFNSAENFGQLVLPDYGYTLSPGEKISYYPTGTYSTYLSIKDYQTVNSVQSSSYGLDWMLSTRKIKPLETAFTFSSNLFYSRYFNNVDRIVAVTTPVEVGGESAWYGIYRPERSRTVTLTSKFGSMTHIPRIGFVVSLNADIYWLKNVSRPVKNQEPIAYVNNRMEYIPIDHFSPEHPVYGHLTILDDKAINTSQHFAYGIINLSVAKEIKRNIRFSITGYNALNLHPEYFREQPGAEPIHHVYNSNVSLTGSVSIKF